MTDLGHERSLKAIGGFGHSRGLNAIGAFGTRTPPERDRRIRDTNAAWKRSADSAHERGLNANDGFGTTAA